MKAFLLAAGFGTRLRPLTDTTPKCLIPIAGKPLLEYWLALFRRHGVTDVLINTHYLRDTVRKFIDRHNRAGQQPQITELFEPELLGSGGTVAANRGFVAGESSFFICYADNLTNIDLTELRRQHERCGAPLTMALFRAGNPSQCGIATLDDTGRIAEFVEKPTKPASNLANAGVYIAGPALFDFFSSQSFLDFGKDVLPLLAGRMAGWETKDYLLDIGTPENYQKAQEDVKWIIKQA